MDRPEPQQTTIPHTTPGDPFPFVYQPLAIDNIRLLRILPRRDEQPTIACHVFDVPLVGSETTYLYEALSYVWGSEEKPRSISIDGCDFAVGENLYAALCSLQHAHLERIIWIDAVCINQDNLVEKGQQVQRMNEIYARARGVIVWLGEPTATSD